MPESWLDPGEKKTTMKDTFQANRELADEVYIRWYLVNVNFLRHNNGIVVK